MRNISTSGLLIDELRAPIWRGLALANLRVELEGKTFPLGSGEVVSTGRGVGIRLHTSKPGKDFVAALTSMKRPDLKVHTGESMDGHIRFFERMHMLHGHMRDMVFNNEASTRAGWKKIHSKDEVARTFSRIEDGEIVATVSALQAWSNTWLGQHLGADPNRTGCSPGQLLLAFLDHVVPRDDCHRMLFFATRGNERMQRIHERFAGMTGTNEAMIRCELDLWVVPRAKRKPLPPHVECRPPKRRELVMIENAAGREFGPEAAHALSMSADTLSLRDLSKRFARVGLERTRRIEVVLVDGEPVLAAIHEESSDGVCIAGFTNATWLFPLPPRQSIDTRALASAQRAYVLSLPSAHADRFVVCSAADADAFRALGAAIGFELTMRVLNRSGLRRYTAYLNQSYGGAQTQRQQGANVAAS
ncbi:MAG: GNAT family N-acetyltransferase [Myxococcota bacterium]